MTISSQVRTAGPFTGNGVAMGGPFTFKIFAATEMTVVQTTDLGVDSTLVYGVDFSITLNPDQNAAPGGTINYLIAGVPSLIPTNYKLNATSNVLNLQPVKINNNGGFFPSVINDALDRLTILVQQTIRSVNSSFKIPLSDGTALNTTLVNATSRANKVFAFDANGAPVMSTLTLAQIEAPQVGAAASAAAAAGSAATATTQAGIATTQAGNASTSATAAQTAQAAAEAAAAGMKWRPSVRAATTGTLPACTYSNGASGVGATLTGNVNGALVAQDGVTLTVGQILLVKDQAAQLQNGVYTLTQVGTGGLPFILTRRTDADTWAELISQVVAIEEGTTLADQVYICTVNQGGTIGTTAVTWTQLVIPVVIASQAEAEAGVENTKTMTALRVLQSITFNFLTALNNNNSGYAIGRNHAASTAVATTTTSIPIDDTIPQITEGAEFLTVTYTPKFANSILRITACIMASTSGNDTWVAAIFRDATANAIKAIAQRNDTVNVNQALMFLAETPATAASATTFRLRLGVAAGTLTVNGVSAARLFGGVAPLTLTIEELRA